MTGSLSLSSILERRVAIVGIGQELRGDDAAGIAVVRGLAPHENVLILEAASVPENITPSLRHFHPDVVLLVDAVQVNAAPGMVQIVDIDASTGLSASTHSLPLHVLADYWRSELACDVILIGIQPLQNAIGAPLSAPVKQAVCRLIADINAACTR